MNQRGPIVCGKLDSGIVYGIQNERGQCFSASFIFYIKIVPILAYYKGYSTQLLSTGTLWSAQNEEMSNT
jgi:hypothetical protein